MTPSAEVLAEFYKEATRERLLKALGNDAPADLRKIVGLDPERMAYEYDATWACETYGEVYRDCPEAAKSEAVASSKDFELCRSCKAKRWLEDNPEVSA